MENKKVNKNSQNVMNFMKTKKEIRFYADLEKYDFYTKAIEKGGFRSLREFGLQAFDELANKTLENKKNC